MRSDKRWRVWAGVLLAGLTLLAYYRVLDNEFLNFDDDVYVTNNPRVQEGITLPGIAWAFTTFHGSNWHPLTWLSHMLDWQLWNGDPEGHHLTSLLLHIANSLLLLLVLSRMTGSFWKSWFVAALFALHPLHVESVAWVSERKDVLSTLFWLLTMWAYVRYVEFKVQGSKSKVGAYFSVIVLFALGLMAKPMLVTLPFALLLLDCWPARRRFAHVIEKLPLLALSAVSAIVTFIAQEKGGAVGSFEHFPLGTRAANAVVSYTTYIGRMLWPRKLAAFYPHPFDALPIWQVVGAGMLLTGVTALVIGQARRRPYLAVGWLWYLITLLPTVGLVQVGLHATADRYTYVPLIGLFIMVAWGNGGMAEWGNGRKEERKNGRCSVPTFFLSSFLLISAAVALLALLICTWAHVGYWRDSTTLFRHTIAVTRNNARAHYNLGVALVHAGLPDEAARHFAATVRIHPGDVDAHFNLGNMLAQTGRMEEAAEQFRICVSLDPGDADAHNNLGRALMILGRPDEAVHEFQQALRLRPDDPNPTSRMH